MKKVCLLLLLSFFAFTLQSQVKTEKQKEFNFGLNLGFNASFPIVNSLTIDGVAAENVNLQYKVGYLVSAFCRINMNRFFIQPGVSLHHSEGNINYSLPDDLLLTDFKSAVPYSSERLNISTYSIETPVLIGFNLVKEYPYSLSFQAGPKIKYTYSSEYTPGVNPESLELINENSPYGVNAMAGVSFSIWRMFFDFYYEYGITQTTTDFKNQLSPLPYKSTMQLENRTNKMSFSFGVLF